MKKAPRGTARFSAYLHHQHAQEPQGQGHGGRRLTGDHGSPQRFPIGTYASEPQRRVRDFCASLSDLSELRRSLNFPSRAGNL